ncbi:hypothetical protein DTO96_102397 [Ephemeroptericola cinctiostellae]|uniref:Phage tail tube protein FII n=1 Tax=Ephemeroptericola cinctiostellae TaxID=2268024 RepID=A0A345DE54_9BURK|nr:phage major tail tube protein [Ephemeroptericola cinctiostellae]AXF86642.1 hypothetical protein DTO96_102397 [Ephemeroptericola cinctiostellae]
MSRNILTGFSVFVEGRGHAGDISKIDLPDFALKVEEFSAGGFTGSIEVLMGRLEKAMEIEMTYNTYTPDIMKQVGHKPSVSFAYKIKGMYVKQDGTAAKREITVRAFAKNVKEEPWEPNKKVSMTTKLSVLYYRDEWDGQVLYEVDPEAAILIVDGVDYGSTFRDVLGLS